MSHVPYYNQTDTVSKKMNKNGYEIRAELVAIAKDYIEKQHAANVEYMTKLIALGQVDQSEYLKALKPYTIEAIIEQANKLYGFVATLQ